MCVGLGFCAYLSELFFYNFWEKTMTQNCNIIRKKLNWKKY